MARTWLLTQEHPELRRARFQAVYKRALEPRFPNASQDRRLKAALARLENFYNDLGPDDVEMASNLVWHLSSTRSACGNGCPSRARLSPRRRGLLPLVALHDAL